jgi:N-acetylneuraminic acid mutarotase
MTRQSLNTIAVSLLALAGCERAPTDPTVPLGALAATAGWTSDAPMPTARRHLKAATVNGVIYAIGGYGYVPATGLFQVRRKVEAYDVASNTWTTKTALPAPLNPTGATNIGGKIYVAGGRALYLYDPATDGWTRKADMPSTVALDGQQGAINGKLYVYAGVTINPDGSPGPQRFFRYNPATDTWATLRTPSYARSGGASGVMNGRFYLIGGTLPTSRNGVGTAWDVHIYDPATGWTKRVPERSFGLGSGDLAYATLGGKLYIVGTHYTDSCTYGIGGIYDPASNTLSGFSSRAPLRAYAAGAAAKGQFFVIAGTDYEPIVYDVCGSDGSLTGDVRAYTP